MNPALDGLEPGAGILVDQVEGADGAGLHDGRGLGTAAGATDHGAGVGEIARFGPRGPHDRSPVSPETWEGSAYPIS